MRGKPKALLMSGVPGKRKKRPVAPLSRKGEALKYGAAEDYQTLRQRGAGVQGTVRPLDDAGTYPGVQAGFFDKEEIDHGRSDNDRIDASFEALNGESPWRAADTARNMERWGHGQQVDPLDALMERAFRGDKAAMQALIAALGEDETVKGVGGPSPVQYAGKKKKHRRRALSDQERTLHRNMLATADSVEAVALGHGGKAGTESAKRTLENSDHYRDVAARTKRGQYRQYAAFNPRRGVPMSMVDDAWGRSNLPAPVYHGEREPNDQEQDISVKVHQALKADRTGQFRSILFAALSGDKAAEQAVHDWLEENDLQPKQAPWQDSRDGWQDRDLSESLGMARSSHVTGPETNLPQGTPPESRSAWRELFSEANGNLVQRDLGDAGPQPGQRPARASLSRKGRKRRKPRTPEQVRSDRNVLNMADTRENLGVYSGGKDGTSNPLARDIIRQSDQMRSAVARRRKKNDYSRQKYAGVNAPAGGVIVRGLYYQGGKFIPGSKDMKVNHDQYRQINERRDALKFRRQDGSYDHQAALKYAKKKKDRDKDQPPATSIPDIDGRIARVQRNLIDHVNNIQGHRNQQNPAPPNDPGEQPAKEAKKKRRRRPPTGEQREEVDSLLRGARATERAAMRTKDGTQANAGRIGDGSRKQEALAGLDAAEGMRQTAKSERRKYAGYFGLPQGHAEQELGKHTVTRNATGWGENAYGSGRAANPNTARLLSMAQADDDIGQLIRAYLSGQTDALPALADALGEAGMEDLHNEVLGMGDSAVFSAAFQHAGGDPHNDPDILAMLSGENRSGNTGNRLRAYMNHVTRNPPSRQAPTPSFQSDNQPQPQQFAKKKSKRRKVKMADGERKPTKRQAEDMRIWQESERVHSAWGDPVPQALSEEDMAKEIGKARAARRKRGEPEESSFT